MKNFVLLALVAILASCSGGRVVVTGGGGYPQQYPQNPPVVQSTNGGCDCEMIIGRQCFFTTTVDRFTPRAGGTASFQACGGPAFANLSAEDMQHMNAGYTVQVQAYRYLP